MLVEIEALVLSDNVLITIRRNQNVWIIFIYDPLYQNGNGRTFTANGLIAEDVWADVKAQWDNRDA